MKKVFISLCLLSMSACSTVPVASMAPVTSNAITNEKRLYDAETTYNVASNSYLTAVNHKMLSSSEKLQIKNALVEAYSNLKLARIAFANKDATTANLDLAVIAVTKAMTLLSGSNAK